MAVTLTPVSSGDLWSCAGPCSGYSESHLMTAAGRASHLEVGMPQSHSQMMPDAGWEDLYSPGLAPMTTHTLPCPIDHPSSTSDAWTRPVTGYLLTWDSLDFISPAQCPLATTLLSTASHSALSPPCSGLCQLTFLWHLAAQPHGSVSSPGLGRCQA